MPEAIDARGVRVHNLKGIDVSIPTGSWSSSRASPGSGKSSLAFDTLYAEGHRRYVESLSAYARQFLERMEKPARRRHRRHLSGRRHPAAHAVAQPAVHRGHRHRDPRPPARSSSPGSGGRSAAPAASVVTKDTAESGGPASARPARGLAASWSAFPGLGGRHPARRSLRSAPASAASGASSWAERRSTSKGSIRRRRRAGGRPARGRGPPHRRAEDAPRPPGGLAGDGVRRGRRPRPSCRWSGGRAPVLGGASTAPAAGARSRSRSRASSPSTTPTAPARPATGSATSSRWTRTS